MSTPRVLLTRWRPVRQHPRLWRGYWDGTLTGQARAAGQALLDPHTPERMIQSLLEMQAWTAAEGLLEDELFVELSSAEERRGWGERIQRARADAVAGWYLQVEALQERARSLDEPLATDHDPGEDGEQDLRVLKSLMAQVEQASERHRAELRRQVEERALAAADPEGGARWREELLALVDQDVPEVDQYITNGPTSDLNHPELPRPASRVLCEQPLRRLLAELLGEEPAAPGRHRWKPDPGNTYAWRLLEALYRPTRDEGDVVLRCVAALLGTELRGPRRDADGWTGHIADLSAPGFLALGRARWPAGVPVWLPVDPHAHPPTLEVGGLLIRLVLEGHPPVVAGQLVLDVRELIATLSLPPEQRRRQVLATLGAQVPLTQLYSQQQADPSAAWPGQPGNVTRDPQDPRPLLISAPPGLGKTVLLQQLGQREGVAVLGPRDELPERGPVLIDCAQSLDPKQARELVRAIHWILDQDPPPDVYVVARPEAAYLLKTVRDGFFQWKELPPLSPLQARAQAQALLAWGGLRARTPHLIDQIAALSGGNPAGLFALCESLAVELKEERLRPGQPREFSQDTLDRAWASPSLRERLRVLTWEPLSTLPGARAFGMALTQYSKPDGSIIWDDLVWATGQCRGPTEAGALERLRDLFKSYTLIRTDDNWGHVKLLRTGPARLLADWVGAHEEPPGQ